MSEHPWIPLPDDAPFPERMQGEWVDTTLGEPVLLIDGRRIVLNGNDLPVGDLSIIEDGGNFAVRNHRDVDSSQLPWGQQTLHVFWFNPGEDELNFEGICDHGWAVRAPATQETRC